MTERASGQSADALLRALGRLLRPLVRLLIGSGITYPVMADLLRELYLDVATRDVLTDDKARTDSRISLLTGVHRKEIRRQRAAAQPHAIPEAVTLATQILDRWLRAPPFADANGPLPLPRSAAPGAASFDALVASVTKDVRARAVLDEWVSQGLVRLDDADSVVLNDSAFIPRPGRQEQLFYFGRNLHDHIAAAAANVSAAGTAPFMDRSVHYDGLSEAAAAQLESAAREAGMRLLIDINRTAAALADAHDPADGPTRRVNMGVYVFAEAEPPVGPAA